MNERRMHFSQLFSIDYALINWDPGLYIIFSDMEPQFASEHAVLRALCYSIILCLSSHLCLPLASLTISKSKQENIYSGGKKACVMT